MANTEAKLNKDTDSPVPAPDKAPEGYIKHHHEDGTIMILVEKVIHREFPLRRLGGVLGVQLKDVSKGEEYDRIINRKNR
ncbi:HNH endonuclease [Brevibacillus sp. DP1.3A]|uniref:HNH endonuclease n=1 Tax=Brevibacillus sp. DP1.3A TaxID=2738867 RepID=UPI00156B5452|nr:HNH endonuclease [Brevibacillus sp. DP1.3A]UED76517.1 HNH endonuclease [Brevibacillus sp. DP1.3A]